MKTWTQDPDENLDYGFDWSDWLSSGETIASSEWVIPDGLTAGAASNTATTTTQWISGGTETYRAPYNWSYRPLASTGSTWPNAYVVINRITTSAGRIAERSFALAIVRSIARDDVGFVSVSSLSSALTLTEVKEHVRVVTSTDDTLLTNFMLQAKQYCELRTGRLYPSSVPEPIKGAMKLLIGHWYEHREAVDVDALKELELGVAALLAPFESVGMA